MQKKILKTPKVWNQSIRSHQLTAVFWYIISKNCVQHTWTFKITHTHTPSLLQISSVQLSDGKKNTLIGCNFDSQCCPRGLHFSYYSCVAATTEEIYLTNWTSSLYLSWCFSFITLRKTHPTSYICLWSAIFFLSFHVAIHPHSVEHWHTHTLVRWLEFPAVSNSRATQLISVHQKMFNRCETRVPRLYLTFSQYHPVSRFNQVR